MIQTCESGLSTEGLFCIGDTELVNWRKIGVICSVKCPGSIILQTYGLMQSLRNEDIAVVSGFHSPMERECLNILLRGTCGIVFCPARGIPRRIPSQLKKPIEDGRVLVLSPFDEKHKRPTSDASILRNRLVAALGDVVFIPYASRGGKVEELCKEIIGGGKPVYTFAGEHSASLTAIGSQPITPADFGCLSGDLP